MCPPYCPNSIDKFIYQNGFRIQKSNKVGIGGFSTVFSGRIHGMDVATKYIDVTEKYKELLGTGSSYHPSDITGGTTVV